MNSQHGGNSEPPKDIEKVLGEILSNLVAKVWAPKGVAIETGYLLEEAAQDIKNIISNERTRAKIEVLERIYCCDVEATNSADPLDVCRGTHLELLTKLKAELKAPPIPGKGKDDE